MGGSYFDFALLNMDEGIIVERAIGTDYVDLDNCVVKLCMEDLAEKLHTQISDRPVALLRLKRGCEIAKRQLSTQMHSRIEVRGIVAGMDYVCNLNRMQLDALCREDLTPLLDPIAWCLEDLGLEKADVQEVVIVGGSAHIPRVQHLLREFFHGKALHEVVRPEHAAVLGAAAYASILADPGHTSSELQHIRLQPVTPWWNVAETTSEKERVFEPDVSGLSDASSEHSDAIPSEQTVNLLNTTKEWVGLRHATAPTAKAWVRKNQPHGKITVETLVDCV
jgi:L1 cell adhesion molecule like protein